jgi:hypothetical protein
VSSAGIADNGACCSVAVSVAAGGGGGTYTGGVADAVGWTVVVAKAAGACVGASPLSAPNCSKPKSIPSVGTSVMPNIAKARQERTNPACLERVCEQRDSEETNRTAPIRHFHHRQSNETLINIIIADLQSEETG